MSALYRNSPIGLVALGKTHKREQTYFQVGKPTSQRRSLNSLETALRAQRRRFTLLPLGLCICSTIFITSAYASVAYISYTEGRSKAYCTVEAIVFLVCKYFFRCKLSSVFDPRSNGVHIGSSLNNRMAFMYCQAISGLLCNTIGNLTFLLSVVKR